ncbi:MAG: PIN domain-containing protein [Armatimonadota bacterium]|jgi:uncharacterized protein YacL
MLSARPFWVIFTVCIILLVEATAIFPITKWRIDEELAGMGLTGKEVFYDKAQNPDAQIKKSDLAKLSFGQKWNMLNTEEPVKTAGIVGALALIGMLAGFLIASVTFRQLVKFGEKLRKLSTLDKVAVFFGVLIGLLLNAVLLPVAMAVLRQPPDRLILGLVGIIITYLCVIAVLNIKDEVVYYFPGLSRGGEMDHPAQMPKILDTNVIIDGRITEVCRTGFVEGQVLVPTFVLEELQHIADSSDSLRRARGRRGLDILNQLRNELGLVVRQCDGIDPENPEEVDARLVKLAKELNASIVTNDFNLNKVAELQGVPVLNINELANALKPVVLPGEELTVTVIKEGKEYNQGVAYLDDGTMIVIEGARRSINEIVEVTVTSVLQTVAGKMIFANLKEAQQEEDQVIDRNIRSYSGIRTRKKIR